MAYERVVGLPLPTTDMLFDGTMYDLGWDGMRDLAEPDTNILPSPDYAIYLINAVKFHCGQMFHLFDEETFMQQFSEFHAAPDHAPRPRTLWYVHYLLILAFGKAFVVQGNSSGPPPGAELFVQAMKLLPSVVFLSTQPIPSVEILCCAALYLQCLDFRCSAYNTVSQTSEASISANHQQRLAKRCALRSNKACTRTWKLMV